jgi:hypothetical protein
MVYGPQNDGTYHQNGTGDLDPAWRDGSAEALPGAHAVWALPA